MHYKGDHMAGFYRVEADGSLSVAVEGLATPAGTYRVADYPSPAPLPSGWRYFESDQAALVALAQAAVPTTCTRTQGLLVLLASGISDPEATILAAIDGIADAGARTEARIRFGAATWHRDGLIAYRGLLGKTVAEIDAMLLAAQAY